MISTNEKNYMGFVFLPSMYQVIERLPNAQAGELALAIIKYGVTGIYEKSSDILIDSVMISLTPVIESGIQKYVQKLEDGNTGGSKPKIDREKVYKLKAQGLTNEAIAREMSCCVNSVGIILRAKVQEEHKRTSTNTSTNPPTTKNQERDSDIASYNANANANDSDIAIAKDIDFDFGIKENENKSKTQPKVKKPIKENINECDVINLIKDISGYNYDTLIYTRLQAELKDCYSLDEIYSLIETHREQLEEHINSPCVECFGDERAAKIVFDLLANEKKELTRSSNLPAFQKKEEFNNMLNDYENDDLPF